MKVAFIGVGNMGGPMAHNLLKAGHALTVFDVVRSNVDALVAHGASAADSARQAAGAGDIVVTMLPPLRRTSGASISEMTAFSREPRPAFR